MYYLLAVVAASVSLPVDGEKLNQVAADGLPAAELTAYDERRIDYNVRQWEGELNEEAQVHIGIFETLEECKSFRGSLRIALREADVADRIHSNCFESRTDAEVAGSEEQDSSDTDG